LQARRFSWWTSYSAFVSVVMTALANNVRTTYQRKPMKDFEYLSSQITPTTTQWLVTLLIAVLLAGLLVWFFQVNDVFE
jgi:phosphate/sulfate permease